jgi:glycosyltransferase involved in cell wall biosynthesis
VSNSTKLVVFGMMTKMPVAGVVWQTVHYLVGFKRLGYDVYYVEAHARTPSMLMAHPNDDASAKAAAFIADVMTRFDLGDRWAFHALHGDGRCYGMSKRRLHTLYRDAALLVNLHGGTTPLPEHAQTGKLVYLETDPVELQVELQEEVASTIEFLEPHCAFFTFAENLGAPDCGLPVPERYTFKPTRQPVVLDLWGRASASTRNVFTTIGNWRQSWRSVSFRDEIYHWSKHLEFEKFVDVPARTGRAFELALSSIEPDERRSLETAGWKVKDALAVSADIDDYRAYVSRSRAEFTVAKDQNVRLRTGWFSDRSATYLAAGRPVVTQDTGFGNSLPVGRGLFAFSTGDEVAAAVEQIDRNYRNERAAAREVAAEFFDANVVLSRLLEDVGLPTSSRAAAVVTPQRPSRRLNAEQAQVSVVIPCFDLGEYVVEAVESVRGQTYLPAELIVVDDGSSDPATLETLEALDRDGVTVIHTENGGAPAARNRGIELARSELILCLDADDVLAPTFLEATTTALCEHPDAAIAATHVEFFGDFDGLWEPPDFDPTLLLWENCIGSASLFRRSAWREAGGYADLAAFQDWDLWISMIERGWRWLVVPEVLYRYRVRSGSISELGRELRPELLKAIQDRHADTYRKNSIAVRVGMDSEIKRLREVVRTQEHQIRARDGEVLSLREELRDRQDGVEASVVAPEGDTPVFDRLESVVATVASPDARTVGAVVDRSGDLQLAPLGSWSQDASGVARAAFSEIEQMRARGAEFLLVPPASREALETATDLCRLLESSYYAALRDDDEGIVFDLRQRLDPPSFSVVICTYRRPELLRRSLASAVAQDYPTDRYEVIVIDNEPSEQARAIVAKAAEGTDVPVAYHVEDRKGLSSARNSGSARSRGDFVAFLDDDAVAAPHWLTSFATIVNQYGALVVGGRVELRVEDGSPEPDWLAGQYPRGFFGLNYRHWGKPDRVVRIRRPLYLGGGNSAYARRLFSHFGGFRPDLGRRGERLLAAEETLLNALLERHDVPVYYSDDAVVEHLVSARRLTKRHIRRKAYWAGVSNAVAEKLLDQGRAPWMRKGGGKHGFELAHDIGLALWRTRNVVLPRGSRPDTPAEQIAWTVEHWLAELEQWPEGRAKHEELANALAVLGREEDAQEALARASAYSVSPESNVNRSFASRRLLRAQYELLVQEVHRIVESVVPAGSRVLVASKGDERLVTLPGRHGWHFPQDDQGIYAGYYPSDSDDAITQLESLHRRGADYLVLPVTSLWWLDHYKGLARHLDEHCHLVQDGEPCTIYALSESAQLLGTSRQEDSQRVPLSVSA